MSKYSSYEDTELIKLLKESRKKKEMAFEEIYNRYSKLIIGYCRMLIGNIDAAEDIFQETFIRFYKSIEKNVEITNISGYLTVIARNLCYNHKRDTKHTVEVDEKHIIYDQSINIENKELLELIIKSLEVLEQKYRDPFVMREFDGMSYKEIAKKLDITIDNAKTRCLRAKRKIIKILDPYLKDIQNN